MKSHSKMHNSLVSQYPRIFGNEVPELGFGVCKGWMRLVKSLCSHIDEVLAQDPNAHLRVDQVKEKFGSLCFYYGLTDASDTTKTSIYELVNQACEASRSICQQCSRPGLKRQHKYIVATMCEHCFKDWVLRD